MAEAAVASLMETITEVTKWHKNLASVMGEELNLLKNDLNKLKELLGKVDEKCKKKEEFTELEKETREVVYELEVTIDSYLTSDIRSYRSSFKRSLIVRSIGHLALNINQAKEHRSLGDTLEPLLEKVNKIVGEDSRGAGTSVDEPPSNGVKVQTMRRDKVVGFEDEEAKLISYLMEGKDKKLDVISIIGEAGLGKTTLARKIFENEKICYEFPVRIWVHVSPRFSGRDVFLKILRKITSRDMSTLTDEKLRESVHACLSKEKFLVVMDDVCATDDWEVIEKALPKGNGFGKVVITSRERSVGEDAKVRTQPYMLRFFNHDESWKLLQLEVFGNAESCPPELESVGGGIADQCGGVPLKVVVVGGLLAEIPRRRETWENVFQKVEACSCIEQVIELSYNRLPHFLRDCFLYTAAFPEEDVISAWKLTRLWIAEGFILHKEGKDLEEIAQENLDDLISRNLLVADSVNPIGKIKNCRVHRVIHEFCRSEALKLNLFQEIEKGELSPPVSENPKFLRLCFQSDINDFPAQKLKERCRSVLCFYKEPVVLDSKCIIYDFTLLRVLESMSFKSDQFPVKLTKLIHMRYITLNIDNLDTLPETLVKLWNLHTLVVETKSPTLSMKANIWRMYRLRSFKTKAAIVLDKKREGEGGENLHTLTTLSPQSCTPDVPSAARNLKTLGIRGKLGSITMSLDEFAHLEKLKLVNDETGSQVPPNLKSFPPQLKSLTLSNTSLEWSQMTTLANINTLEVLKLKDNAFAGLFWSAKDCSFPKLQLLLIADADLVHWEVSDTSFPTIQCLVLRNCENLNEIPEGLTKTLQKLDINRLGNSAVHSARRIQQQKLESMLPFKLTIAY